MKQRVAEIYAFITAFLGLAGLFVTGAHLFGIFNADLLLDIVRIGLAVYLTFAAFVSEKTRDLRGALLITGIAYVGFGIIGYVDSTAWGLLPTGLTGFDNVFHLATGFIALVAAVAPRSNNLELTR